MAVDIASIGIELDSRQVVEGTRALDVLAETSTKVEQKVGSMNAGMNSTSQIMRANAEAAKTASEASQTLLAKLQREIDLYGLNRAESERYKAAMAGMSSATQQAAAALGAKIDAMQRDERAAREAAAAEDQAAKAADRFVKSLQDQVATLGMNTSQLLAYRAAQLGVADAAAPMIKKIEEAGAGAKGAAGHMEGLSFQSVGARRELLVLAHELSQGNFQKFGGSMMVLGEQTGAAGLLFSAAGVAALGLTAAVVGVGYAVIKGASEQRAMNNALIETGNYAGVTSDQLNSMAHAAVEAGGSIREAKKVVTELAGTGKFTGEQIGYITEAAIAMEHATGKSVEATIKQFESLAVQTSGNTLRSTETISRAALKLDDQYHFLTESVYEQIRALEKEGDQKGASALATETLANVTKHRAEEMAANIGSIQRGWNSVKEVIGEVVDGLGKIGMKNTPASDAAKASAKLTSFDDGLKVAGITDPEHELTGRWAETRKRLVLELVDAYDKLNKADAAAIAQGKATMAQSEAAHAASRIEQDDIRLGKKGMSELDDAIQKYGEDLAKIAVGNPTSKLLDQDVVNRHMALIIKDHAVAAKGNDDRSALLQDALTREQTALDREKSIYDARGKMLDLYHTKFGMSDAEFYAGREAARAEYLASEAISFAKESALVKAAEAQARNPQEVAAAKGKYDQLVKAHEKFVDEMRNAGGEDRSNADAAAQKPYDDIVKAGEAQIKSLDEQIKKEKEHNEEIGKTAAQIELIRQARAEAAAENMQREADAINALLTQTDLQGILVGKDRDAYEARLSYLNRTITKEQELATLRAAGADQEALAKASADLDKYLDPTKAEKFGHALRGSLNGAVKSMDDLSNAMLKFSAQQAAADKARSEAQLLLKGNDQERAKGLADLDQINRKSTQEQLAGYGNMASAAAGFFDHNSRGYKALQTASEVMYAAQLAMNLASIAPAMAAGAAQMFAQSGWGGFAGVAAMTALVAGFGVAVSGSDNVNVSHDRQAAQGAGSVLGDSDAKSESIRRALAAVEKNTYQGLAISTGMLATLQSIDSNTAAFASQLVRSTDITNPDINLKSGVSGANLGTAALAAGGFVAGGMVTLLSSVMGPIGAVVGTLASRIPAVQHLMTSIFGGKQSVEDSGFGMDAASLASILGNGAHAYQYADIKTSGGWFSKDKTSEQSNPLNDSANQQFTTIIRSMADSIKAAGGMLGMAGDDFTNKLNSFVVDIGHISLKDLKGDDLQKALESVFSKLGDQMAQYAIGGLQGLQKVGEGYLETLARVATEYQTIDVVFQSFGKTFGQVGLESIAARDRLVQLAGGLDQFTSQGEYFLKNFFTDQEQAAALRARIDPTLAQYGLSSAGENADKMFRNFIVGLDTTTEEGAKAYTTLMTVAPALRAVIDAGKDVLEERKGLLDQLDDLTMSDSQKLAKKRAALLSDDNRLLFDQVQAAQATKDAAQAAKDALQKQVDTQRSLLDLQAQIYELTGDKARAAAVLEQQHIAALADLDPALRDATQQLWNLQAAAKATQDAAKVAQAVKDAATGLLGGVDNAFSVLQKVAAREKTAVQAIVDAHSAAVTRLQGLSQALHGAFDGSLSADQKLAARAQAQAEIKADLAITKAGGTLSDAQVESLKKALGAVTADASGQYGSYADYMRDLYSTQSDIGQLADLTDSSLSIEQLMLDQSKAQLQRLDDIVANGQAQIDALNGQSVATLTLAQAMAGMQSSIGAAQANPVVAGTSGVAGLYQSLLGRAPDQSGMQYWQDALARGMSLSDVGDWIKRSDEYKGLHPFAVGTNFIPEDMPAYLHKGEAVIPAADNRLLFSVLSRAASPQGSSEALVAEVRGLRADNAALREEVKGLRAETRATATHGEKTARLLTRVIREDKLITATEGE